MGSNAVHLAWLALAWAAYGGLHSLLAAAGFKGCVAARLPRWVPAYRLLYNLVAVLALLPILGLDSQQRRQRRQHGVGRQSGQAVTQAATVALAAFEQTGYAIIGALQQ